MKEIKEYLKNQKDLAWMRFAASVTPKEDGSIDLDMVLESVMEVREKEKDLFKFNKVHGKK
jgi:hypothetical protein